MDLLVGFRVFVVLTALSVAVVMLMRDGRIRLFTKAPTYGSAAVLLIVAMLLVHTARFAIFDQIAVLKGAPRIVEHQEMRGDILQFEKPTTRPKVPLASTNSSASASVKGATNEISRWLAIPFNLLQRSEPSIIQATLAESCSATFHAAHQISSNRFFFSFRRASHDWCLIHFRRHSLMNTSQFYIQT